MALLARESWIQAPYTDADYLSTGVQQHPGNGVAVDAAGVVTVASRFSVARTRRGYVTNTPASTVYSMTPGLRQAYGGTVGTTPDLDRGPYQFSTDS